MRSMETTGPATLLSAVAHIAVNAGKVILPFFRNDCGHRLKADNSPVTQADLASHDLLANALAELTPGHLVISEESSGPSATPNPPLEEYWLVDPLDGTKEFLKGKPGFTVNVALMRQGSPALGVVHAPALGLTYCAQAGAGAWRQAPGESPVPIRTRPAQLEQLVVVASRDHSGPAVKRLLEKLHSPQLTTIGSSLKLCLIAEGRADLYFRDVPTMEWDTAAAQCLLETAGGQVLDLHGNALGYGKKDLRNPEFLALGDPAFRWRDLAPGSDDRAAFRALFAVVGKGPAGAAEPPRRR